MTTSHHFASFVLESISAVRRAQREIEHSRARLAASQRILGTSLERLCEAERRLEESEQASIGGQRSVEA